MYYGSKSPHGGDIYESDIRLDFSANVNPYGMPDAVKRAAAEALEEAERYPDPYCRELAAAIAEAEGLPKEDIFIGNGASELIFAYCMAQKFRKVILPVPAFSEYEENLKKAGSGIIYYRMKEAGGFLPDEGLLSLLEGPAEAANRLGKEQTGTDRTGTDQTAGNEFRGELPDALFLCSPNNPTGMSVPLELMKKVLETVRKRKICLFMDECFYELSDGKHTLKNELADNRNIFILRAFTKCYGMAGLRLGYGLCADHELLAKMSLYTPAWSVSGPAQKAGLAALKEKAFLEETVRKIRLERQRLTEQMQSLGLTVFPSEVNYLFFKGPKDLYDRLLAEGILIRNCANYAGLSAGYYRIAVRTPKENREFLRILRQVLTAA